MPVYEASGYGRKVGAIGICGSFACIVHGDTEEAARLAVYKQYEHISGGTAGITLKSCPASTTGICSNCGQWQHAPTDDCFHECRRRGFVPGGAR